MTAWVPEDLRPTDELACGCIVDLDTALLVLVRYACPEGHRPRQLEPEDDHREWRDLGDPVG